MSNGKRKKSLGPPPPAEFESRLAKVREGMGERGLDACLISAPENVFYLTGLDHQGYFAFELLIVPREGSPILVTRAMERATVEDQVPWIEHVGYSDGVDPLPKPEPGADNIVMTERDEEGRSVGLRPWEMSFGVSVQGPVADAGLNPIKETVKALEGAGLGGAKLGLERKVSFFPLHIAQGIIDALPKATWTDCSGLVDDCRLIQSPLELQYTRAAAKISDSMMLAAIAAAGEGVYERGVMASLYDAMFRRGGTYPGFIPLVRSTRTLRHEHGTWTDGQLRKKDLLFLEMAGCVRHYHAPLGRLVFIDQAPKRSEKIRQVCEAAMMKAAGAIGPGVKADEVYRAWESVLKDRGLGEYSRHHCGYAVGIGFPPSWSGSGTPRGLRKGSDMELAEGMVFHLMSWLLRTGKGDSFLSDTIVVTADGCEFLTNTSRELTVR